jgi:hypothetical protein
MNRRHEKATAAGGVASTPAATKTQDSDSILLLSETFEPMARELGVARRVLDVAVHEPLLKRPVSWPSCASL